MGYREEYFKVHKGVFGKYRCVRCGKWFKKQDIDIDHIIPQSHLKLVPKDWKNNINNLQPMCKHCNRSKGAKTTNTATDLVSNVAKNALLGVIKGGSKKSKPKKRR